MVVIERDPTPSRENRAWRGTPVIAVIAVIGKATGDV
jgi:hypothetical protein